MNELLTPVDAVDSVDAVIDRVSTAELLKRYGLGSRTGLSNRMEALGIVAYKEGKQYYVPVDAVEQLDALNECLKRSGATLVECARSVQQMQNGSSRSDYSALAPSYDNLPSLPYPIVIQMQPAPDPLANYRLLEEIAQKGWQLPTSQLLSLLGLKSVPRLQDYTFYRHGFYFVRTGRSGRESEWCVKKL